MSQAEVQRTISAIIADLCHEKPDWKGMISTINDLSEQVGRWNLLKPEQSGEPSQWADQEPSIIRMHLEELEAALSEKNIPKAVEHAESALRALESSTQVA